jgi:hypothetical protein
MVQDREEPYRYTDPELILIINTALTEVKRLRPDAFAGSFQATTPQFYDPLGVDPADGSIPTTDPWPIDEMFLAPVIEYVAGYAELRDDEFVDGASTGVAGRAGMLLNRFSARLLSNTI